MSAKKLPFIRACPACGGPIASDTGQHVVRRGAGFVRLPEACPAFPPAADPVREYTRRFKEREAACTAYVGGEVRVVRKRGEGGEPTTLGLRLAQYHANRERRAVAVVVHVERKPPRTAATVGPCERCVGHCRHEAGA